MDSMRNHVGRIAIGDISVAWVPEVVNRPYDPTFFFPDFSSEAIEPHLPWLAPRFFDIDRNRFILNTHTYIVRTGHHTVVVDTCLGNDKVRRHYPHLDKRQGSYLDDLKAVGVNVADVDIVLCTHLHIDHVGWNTRLENGRWLPTFPNARYVMSRRELEFATQEAKTKPHLADGSFEDSVLPIVDAGRADLIDGTHALADGLVIAPTPGHTPGHIVLTLDSRGQAGVLSGDLVHNPVQYALPDWNSAFCHDGTVARTTRRAFLERYSDTGTIILPGHFPAPTAGRIGAHGGHFRFREIG